MKLIVLSAVLTIVIFVSACTRNVFHKSELQNMQKSYRGAPNDERRSQHLDFNSRSITLTGTFTVTGLIDEVFELFSPLGERLWVPDWDPELLYPVDSEWEEEQLFRTKVETGDAVWIVTRLNRSTHEVTYHRVEPDRYVARVNVWCRELTDKSIEVRTSYTFVGLTENGNREIASMSQQTYDEKIERWKRWINAHLKKHP